MPVTSAGFPSQYAGNYFPPSPPSTIGAAGVDAEQDDNLWTTESSLPLPASPTGESQTHPCRNTLSSDTDDQKASCACANESGAGICGHSASAQAIQLADHYIKCENRPAMSQHLFPETPQQTPSHSARASPGNAMSVTPHPFKQSAQTFFLSVFPQFPTGHLSEHQGGIADDAGVDLICPGWRGALLDRTRLGGQRAMYALLSSSRVANDSDQLRNDLLALLDLATETHACTRCIIGLDRAVLSDAEVKATLHGLCYVGGSLVGRTSEATAAVDPVTGFVVNDSVALVVVDL